MKRTAAALFLAVAVAFSALNVQAKPSKAHHDNGRHVGQLRKLQFATLPDAEIAYALTHQQQSIARLRSMRRIDASHVWIVRLTATQKARFHVSMLSGAVAYEQFNALDAHSNVAQIFNTNNPLLQQLQSILAGMVVTNAINNTLGGSTGGATSTLAQVLLNSGIPLSSLLGVFFDQSGILNAIVG
jgi:hypothetical protein